MEHGTSRAEMTVERLFARRRLRVDPPGRVHPGDSITLAWSPADDEWSGYDASTEVMIYWPDDFSAHVERNRLNVDLPRFSFTLPDVRPGRAKVSLSTVYLEAHPPILACRGVHRCSASVHNGPEEVEVTVAPRARTHNP